MSSAPAWISYASGGVSIGALLLSTATYRRAGPRIKAHVSLSSFMQQDDNDVILEIDVWNKGLAPVDIRGFYMAGGYGVDMPAWQFNESHFYDGAVLPHRLEAGSTRRWTLSMRNSRPPAEVMRKSRKKVDVLTALTYPLMNGLGVGVVVALGNGVEVRTHLSIGETLTTWRMWKTIKAELA